MADQRSTNQYTQPAPTVRVAILDSGAGGLGIAKAIVEAPLHAEIIYLADLDYFPYGVRPDDELISRITKLIEHLNTDYNPDIYIIACNTASTLVLPTLRSKFSAPFIGVVPAIKPAALLSKSKHISVLATRATTERTYLDALIKDHASDIRVHKYGSQILVTLAEDYIRNKSIDKKTLTSELNSLLAFAPHSDVVVLACTHFPLLKPLIEAQLHAHGIVTLDSTKAIILRLITLMPSIQQDTLPSHTSIDVINTTDEHLQHYADYLLNDSRQERTEDLLRLKINYSK